MITSSGTTRRGFLGAATGIAGAAVLRGEPNLKFPTEPRARIAVASYPFREFINKPNGIDLLDFPQMVVDRFHIHNVEPLSSHFKSMDTAYVENLRRHVEKAGSQVINIPCDIHPSLGSPDDAAWKKAVALGKKWVDVAVALNSPSIRAHIAPVNMAEPPLQRTADGLNAVVEYASFKGVVVNLENDDPRSEDAAFIVNLIKSLDTRYLRALPDFCNSRIKGDDQYNYNALAALFPLAYNVSHVKDSEVDNGKVYRTDPVKIFGIARNAGYRGYFSIEFEGEGDPYTGTQKLIDISVRAM
ncbi:MAG TPA: sugar phosphate isomerase/epimerase family protein [Bryobacteraceae bacterium]|nr:sugar phosphate isomerase/epimerase family protein [Bryobacteraceae bacterium]